VVARARERGLVFQTIPNVSTKYEALLVGLMSAGFFLRKKLKTAVVSLMDIRSSPGLYKVLEGLGWFFNKLLGAELRFQALPVPFDLHADGFELVVFEEFGAGAAGLHLKELAERRKLFADPKYRSWFRSQWRNPFIPKVFHRNFGMAEVLACPDASLVGKTFAAIAEERGATAVDAFLDLVGQYGSELRWYTMMGNDRPGPLASILNYQGSLVGFSDAGAHLRNMAFYNFPLRMLKFVRDAQLAGKPFMTTERAIYRLTGELGDWFGLDAGTLREGGRADLVVVDPQRLDAAVDAVAEEAMPEFGGHKRLVRRNPAAVPAVIVNGRLAVERGEVLPQVGHERGFGTFLKAKPAA
jgi:N-acyl-D-aspartate/D-glutamate deacylase